MQIPGTDLALEAAEFLTAGQKNFSSQPGLGYRSYQRQGYEVTALRVETAEAAERIGKSRGSYVTLDLRPYFRREPDFFRRGALCLREELAPLLPRSGHTLVVGLGNRSMTPDAVGPLVLESLLVTRHLREELPRLLPVSALAAGVTGSTGMEAGELISGVVQALRPAAVIAVDALCARSEERLCATVQISDTGLIPGSGVGNCRLAVNRETLGVPVIAVGIPTVIGASVLSGKPEETERLYVTPRDIDSRVRELSRLVGYGITLALQPTLTLDDVTGLLG